MLFVAACGEPAVDAVPGPTLPPEGADTCGARPYAYLIGQPATALERVLIMRSIRILRPNDIVTMDFAAERINFMIGTNEEIASIRCG